MMASEKQRVAVITVCILTTCPGFSYSVYVSIVLFYYPPIYLIRINALFIP